ncbi:MAG: GNAT family N-acetyltransferase [Clostridia bacterium]|jgi:predicted GNAT family N-acyltransferase|nr:GNAT family N-acetyltransferase [Clostridiaceae bacterium]
MNSKSIFEVIRIQKEEDFSASRTIRKTVFVDEQMVPAENEFDEYETESVHVLVRLNGKPVGTGRIRPKDGVMKCERVCVLKEARMHGVGKTVMKALEEIALEKGYRKTMLHAQTHALPFYRKLGYVQTSDVFYEEGIPHVSMEKNL